MAIYEDEHAPDLTEDLALLSLGEEEHVKEAECESKIHELVVFPGTKQELTLIYNKTEDTFKASLKEEKNVPMRFKDKVPKFLTPQKKVFCDKIWNRSSEHQPNQTCA